jgi:hypothetical protein
MVMDAMRRSKSILQQRFDDSKLDWGPAKVHGDDALRGGVIQTSEELNQFAGGSSSYTSESWVICRGARV